MSPREFLELLWSDKPEDLYLLIWTLQDKRSHWSRGIEEAAAVVEACRHMDTYVGVGLSPQDFGPHHRCPADRIAGLSGLWSDFDIRSEAHSKKALPPTISDALSIVPAVLPPTIVISSGNGAHAWWLYKEPQVFETDEERKEGAALAARFQTMLRAKAASLGWAFERLADLPRVLRLPGTTNWKDPANPKPVMVYSSTGQRYNPSDFEELLDEMGVPDPEAEGRTAREWAQRFADKPLVISLEAAIPETMLNAWMEHDLRFRNTWFRQRHDLKDKSQSGYDLALADFGMDAGLTEQQIADLIIHHRRLHGERPRRRLDYFQRTLSKAANGHGVDTTRTPAIVVTALSPAPPTIESRPSQEAPSDSAAPQDAAPAAPPEPERPPADPEAAKLVLCDEISRQLGIRLVRLVKIAGKEPVYLMELESARIEFPHVSKLISQDAVRVALAATVGKLLPKIKPKNWELIAQMLLDACVIQQGSEEMEFEGAARMYVAQYLAETGFIESPEGQRVQDARRPMFLTDGTGVEHVAICTSDLQVYINKTTFQNLSVRAVASMLAALGSKSLRVRGASFREQSRWLLPTDEFNPADYSARLPQKEAVSASRT